jgi:hypothetical protein
LTSPLLLIDSLCRRRRIKKLEEKARFLHMLSSGFVTASFAGTCRHPPPFLRRVNRMIFPSFICVGSIVWVAVTEQYEYSKLTPRYSSAGCLDSLTLALLSLLQSLHVAVKSMSVVSSELGVGTLERGVTGSLGLLDSTRELAIIRH